jgi:hypothetical protein
MSEDPVKISSRYVWIILFVINNHLELILATNNLIFSKLLKLKFQITKTQKLNKQTDLIPKWVFLKKANSKQWKTVVLHLNNLSNEYFGK